MVFGQVGKWLFVGLGVAYILNAVIRPQHALGTASALTESGTAISSIGAGIGDSLRSIGSGSAKLLDPLFSLKDLIAGFSNLTPGSANVSASANEVVTAGQNSSTITWSSGTQATVPSLSPAAKSYYSSIGVSVS
jgi:hypothetical protein